jgi:hypothetical protein
MVLLTTTTTTTKNNPDRFHFFLYPSQWWKLVNHIQSNIRRWINNTLGCLMTCVCVLGVVV